MSSNNWIHVIMPCLRPRPKEKEEPEQTRTTESYRSEPFAEAAPDRKPFVPEALPQMHEGIEPVTLPEKHRPQTMLVTELPCPTPTRPEFNTAEPRPTVGRSKSEGPTYKRKDNKNLKGKRKRSQTFNISGPSDVRKAPMDDPKLTFPLTYPSPSRQRPERLTMDRRDPSSEIERPRTAPTSQTYHRKDSFPLRSDSLQRRSHAWRLAPLPPLPALRIDDHTPTRKDSSATPIRRKPLPLRIRGSSDPVPSSPRLPYHDTPAHQIGCAVEMPSSVPPTAQKSPYKLAAALSSATPVEKGLDTPAELDSTSREGAKHGAFPSMPSIPTSPTSPIYAHRLSEGARDLLNFFPTTPKIMSRANSTKSTKSTRRAASAEPPLSSRLVEFAESRKLPVGHGAATVVGKKSGIKIQQIEIPKPLFATKPKKDTESDAISPSTVSPRTKLPLSRAKTSPGLYTPKSDDGKSLPPTAETAGFGRGRFISLAAGLEIEDLPTFELAGLGITTDRIDSKRSSAGESIQIFLSGGIEV